MLIVLAHAPFRLISIARTITVCHLPLFAFIPLTTLMATFSNTHFVG